MKTRSRALLLLVCSIAAPAFAGTMSNLLAFPRDNAHSTALSVVQPADYLCGGVVISSRSKDPAKQAEDIRATLQSLMAAAERAARVQLHQGPVRSTPGTNQSLFNSASGWATASLQSNIRLVCRTDGTIPDTFDAARELRLFISAFKPTGDATVTLSTLSLAVDTPERQREPLLELIQQQARTLQTRFGARASVKLSGLDGAVQVRQLDDTNVELFIDYQLSLVVEHP